MITEPALNALLHLSALSASRLDGEEREDARRKILDYLTNHVGLADAEEYIGLYRDLIEAHEGEDEETLSRTAAGIARSLRPLLQGPEKFAAIIHLLHLAAPGRDFPSRVAGTLGRELGIEEASVSRIREFIADPEETAQSGGDGRIIRAGGSDDVRGRLAALRLPGERIFLVASVGDEPLWLEGRPLDKGGCRPLHPGQVVRDRRGNEFYFSGVAAAFREASEERAAVDFRGLEINFRFRGSENGIHDFSFAERDGRMVGIMGGSGSGKSTLLSILNGTLRPDSGRVLLNGRDIHAERETGEGVIGFVPQDDLLFEDLTVFQNLFTAARLCLAHLDDREIARRVRALLAELGQADAADLKVGSPLQKTISGGQRKRLNIALELIREPTVLFVDEPTSGLSSADSENVMSLLKEQAARGKLVFIVIHQPSSKIFRMFDALWILDQGGWPIFSGTPLEAVAYFRRHGGLPETWEAICSGCGGVNPEQIFEIIEAKTVDNAGQLTRRRRITPEQWHALYREHAAGRSGASSAVPSPADLPPPPRSLNRPGRLGQLRIFFGRDVRARLANRSYLLVTFLEPLVLGLLTGLITRGAFGGTYVFHDNDNLHIFFFMSVIVAVFLGLSVSAEEICRDGKILQRERFLRLSWGSYINSKSLYLAAVSALQMFLFAVVAGAVVKLPGMLFPCWAVLFLCAFCSNILGLNISASFRSAVTIYILIPMIVVPQLLLSGVVIPYDDLIAPRSRTREVPLYADLLPPRWGYEALVVEQYVRNAYTRNILKADARVRLAEFDLDQYLPELQSLIQSFPLLREEGKTEEMGKNLRILQNEIPRLAGKTGLTAPAIPSDLGPEAFDSSFQARLSDYVAECRKEIFDRRREAAAERRAVLDRLTREHGADGLEELKRRWTNRAIEKQVLNLQDFEPIGRAEDGLYRKTLPVYQIPESHFGRAHFLAGWKRVDGGLWPTFAFNLAAVSVLTVIFYLLLWIKALPRLLGAPAAGARSKN